MFFNESWRLEQSCNRITKGTFLQNHMEIGPVVSDKKILNFSIKIYKPRPPGSLVFWQIQMAWTILQQDHQRNISAKSYGNRSSGFWRRFLKFSIQIYSENKPCPLAAMFFDKSKWLEQSWYRITKGTFLQNNMEIGPVVLDKKIFKVFYIDI